MSASKACHTKITRSLVLVDGCRTYKEEKYAIARIASIARRERTVVWSITRVYEDEDINDYKVEQLAWKWERISTT